ncbi:biopolymer transporter ExbD [Spirosoma endophyticum]|uniref:Biopolymer transport protein ExbD/TolR n=1 Tax=Spirosoma endophyticum TaxID=662367 RepID=A0A1I1VAF0_9BACT|nr:biopolymer transporter ExbD [Spirosoma endophyticum]SFD79992.1 Biopolymer transport protein ExbD/TolR [Spirosoma endophyticum]
MKIRRRYNSIRIDFTPFVSIALLLIVFFVWVKMVQRPNVLGVWDVQGCRKGIDPATSKRVLEILLTGKDTVQFCYSSSGAVCRANFIPVNRGSAKLCEALFRYGKETLIPGELAILIRPSSASTIGSFVDVLDELRIAGNLPYLLVY